MRSAWFPFAAALILFSVPARGAEYYAGKTLKLVVGSAPGGGYDVYSRIIAQHLPRFIPGHPTIIVQNMPGAGGAKAATFVGSVAPKDGTVIGAISPGAVIGPLLDERTKFEYDPTKLVYLGTANSGTRVCITSGQSKTKTFKDALVFPTVLGTAGEGDSTLDYAFLHKNTTDAKFGIVSGYTNTPDILLAMERGEVDGVCGLDWSSLKAQKADYIRDGGINILVQVGPEPNKELSDLGVPEIWAFMRDDDARQVTDLIVAQQLFSRPYVLPPGTAAGQAEILRLAFSSLMGDAAFMADAARAKVDIAPAPSERIQAGVEGIYAAPRTIVEKAREAIRR